MNAQARFLRKVRIDQITGCWHWRGTFGSGGLPQYSSRSARRIAYTRFIGPVPKGKFPVIECGEDCVCPYHATLRTKVGYIAAAKARGVSYTSASRTARLTAHRRARSLRTMEDARTIRLRAAAGETIRAIATDYSMTYGNVSHIVKGRIWREGSPLVMLARQAGML